MKDTPVPSPSRRAVLAVTAATVSLPMLESALGSLKAARAAGDGAGTPASKPSWITTTLKPDDVKDNEFSIVTGQKIVLARSGKDISAMTNVCTHRGTAINPKAGQKTLTCPSHGSIFNLDGTVGKGPAMVPLQHYAIRLNDKGMIEVDPSQKVTKDAKEATLTVT
jgi:cytochrome b6-f complex iron-sulfur subunit